MLRAKIAFVLVALMLVPAVVRAEPSPAPSPEPGGDGSFTAEDFKALTEARVERVMAAYPKMQLWLKKVDRESQKINQAIEKDGVLSLPSAMKFSKDAVSSEQFAKEVGMPMDEFYRDWGLVVAVHAALLADEAYLVGKKSLEDGLNSPELPDAAKATVREQVALMEKQRDATSLKVPDAVKKLVAARRKKIEVLLGTHEQGSEEQPEPSPDQ